MAKAFKCELCKKLFEGVPVALLSLVAPEGNHYMRNCKIPTLDLADLCADCAHQITGTKRT